MKLIESIYATYRGDTNTPGYADVYSKRLQGLVDKDAKETPEGEAGRFDWDPFVDGNDWRLTEVKVALLSRKGKRAQVGSTFSNHEKPRRILFDLVQDDRSWVIDEIRSMRGPDWKKPAWTMSKVLVGAPDAVAK